MPIRIIQFFNGSTNRLEVNAFHYEIFVGTVNLC